MELDKYYWLFDEVEGLKEKIRFKDRIEYRVSGEIHNSVGPAIIYIDDNGKPKDVSFYIKGRQFTEEDWNIMVRPEKLKRIKNKIKKKDDNDSN